MKNFKKYIIIISNRISLENISSLNFLEYGKNNYFYSLTTHQLIQPTFHNVVNNKHFFNF